MGRGSGRFVTAMKGGWSRVCDVEPRKMLPSFLRRAVWWDYMQASEASLGGVERDWRERERDGERWGMA